MRERLNIFKTEINRDYVRMYGCMCVCVWEREREREIQRDRKRDRDTDRDWETERYRETEKYREAEERGILCATPSFQIMMLFEHAN